MLHYPHRGDVSGFPLPHFLLRPAVTGRDMKTPPTRRGAGSVTDHPERSGGRGRIGGFRSGRGLGAGIEPDGCGLAALDFGGEGGVVFGASAGGGVVADRLANAWPVGPADVAPDSG